MKTQKLCLLLTTLCCSTLFLAGCMTPGRGMIPQGGSMTMEQIYQMQTSGSLTGNGARKEGHSLSAIRGAIIGPAPETNYVAYTATSENQVNNLFKRLPNPEVPIYIFPHLIHMDGQAYPKPGMSTAFFLYKTNHFAMPNEVY